MLKYTIGVVLAGVIGLSFEVIADATPDSSMSAEEVAVIRTEGDWIKAEINNDEVTLRRVIDDQFVFNSNDGTISGKEDLIESVLNWNMTSQKITERTVLIDGDTAVIFGTTELRFASTDAEDTVSLLRYTSTYVKRGEEWRAIALHMARRATDD